MTPDLKRLCEAAASKAITLPISHHYEASSDAADWEDVVRAVLMELREVDVETLFRSQVAVPETASLRDEFSALIDHILDTKARRAAALSELAEIDRDLI